MVVTSSVTSKKNTGPTFDATHYVRMRTYRDTDTKTRHSSWRKKDAHQARLPTSQPPLASSQRETLFDARNLDEDTASGPARFETSLRYQL